MSECSELFRFCLSYYSNITVLSIKYYNIRRYRLSCICCQNVISMNSAGRLMATNTVLHRITYRISECVFLFDVNAGCFVFAHSLMCFLVRPVIDNHTLFVEIIIGVYCISSKDMEIKIEYTIITCKKSP